MATPGTAINRGRTVHRARVVKSICESEDDDMPIFMTRLRDESGDMITGGRAAAGSVGATRARRSWTSCRAGMRSVPFSKIRTTDDKPSTDLERRTSRPGTPFMAASSGTLMSASTSELESPGASVWISTSGGANSGNTSNGASLAALMPTTIRMIESATVRGFSKEIKDGRALYEVELSVKGLTRDLTLDAQGNVVADEQQTTLQDIPAAARAAIEKAATGGKLTLVEKVIEGSSIFYEGHITKGGKELEIKVDANGKPVE